MMRTGSIRSRRDKARSTGHPADAEEQENQSRSQERNHKSPESAPPILPILIGGIPGSGTCREPAVVRIVSGPRWPLKSKSNERSEGIAHAGLAPSCALKVSWNPCRSRPFWNLLATRPPANSRHSTRNRPAGEPSRPVDSRHRSPPKGPTAGRIRRPPLPQPHRLEATPR